MGEGICCRGNRPTVGMNPCASVMIAGVIFSRVVSHSTTSLFCHRGIASQSEAQHPLWVVMKTANATIGFPLGVNEVFSKQNGPT